MAETDTLSDFERVGTGSGNDPLPLRQPPPLGGNDQVKAGSDRRKVGDDGHDPINGGNHHDDLKGENGNDRIRGERGIDSIKGGLRADTVDGGAGGDTSVWHRGEHGSDRIGGFVVGVDSLLFSADAFASGVTAGTDPYDLLLVFDNGDHAVLAANTHQRGWTEIAFLSNVDAVPLRQAIAAGPFFKPAGLSVG